MSRQKPSVSRWSCMKRHEFLRHLRVNGCILKREGAKHSLYMNPANGVVETVPRHVRLITVWQRDLQPARDTGTVTICRGAKMHGHLR